MDGERGIGLGAWLIDLAAAAIAGAAVALCLTLTGMSSAAMAAGAGCFLLSFSGLQCVAPGAARYRLPSFATPGWDGVLDADVLELAELAPEEMMENRGSGVVRLFPMTPLPTAGELKQRIDAHLARSRSADDDNVVLLSADATAALRSALAELKRAIR